MTVQHDAHPAGCLITPMRHSPLVMTGPLMRRSVARMSTAAVEVAERHPSVAATSNVPNLDGSIAWVVGGAGVIGSGLVRGLLRAGATVVCNSRHKPRLEALSQELNHPANLVTLHGSMMPGAAAETVERAMALTGGRLDHVVTHSAVRW